MFNFKKHADYLESWRFAMANSTFDGRTFSKSTQDHYAYYVALFLEQHGKVSFETLVKELGAIPSEQCAKRDQVYRAIICFAKYLIRFKALNKSFLAQAREIRPHRHIPPKRMTVKLEDLNRLFAVATKPLDQLILILLVATGLRASEACSLKIRDIDFESGIITLPKGKWGKSRRLGINEGLDMALKNYLRTRKELASEDYLLLNKFRQPMDRNGLYDRLRRLGRKADVTVSPHALRRAFVTINVSNNVPLPYLQTACGHQDIKTTRSYCQTTEDEVIEAMKTRFTNFSCHPQHPVPPSGYTSSLS
ncbi:MAG: tyrosine-type recombinase/integrase [Oligoflexales bacterium]